MKKVTLLASLAVRPSEQLSPSAPRVALSKNHPGKSLALKTADSMEADYGESAAKQLLDQARMPETVKNTMASPGQSPLAIRLGQFGLASGALVRVKSAGNQVTAFNRLGTRESIPEKYGANARFDTLSADPAHAGEQTATALREAMSGLELESLGHLPFPITRGPAEIEFYDAKGHPYDVKTPRSPEPGDRWTFNERKAARSVVKQLNKSHKNSKTDKDESVRVILDSTYLTPADHSTLWGELRTQLKPEQLGRILEVNVEVS